MTPVPLFSRDELAAAFGQILPSAAARRWALEWFERFADDDLLDERGYFLYENRTPTELFNPREVIAHSREPAQDRSGEPSVEAPVGESRSVYAPESYDYSSFSGMSEDEKGNFLMRFSDFHLNLLAAVSPALFERVRAANHDSSERAQNKRQQTLLIIEAMKR